MTEYYTVHWASEGTKDYKLTGVAYVDESFSSIMVSENGIRVKNWKILEFELRKGIFTDYLPNNVGARMCSQKLRCIIDDIRTLRDDIQWLDAIVKSSNITKIYYILHFPRLYKVLDLKYSVFDEDGLIKPILRADAFKERHLCSIPDKYGVQWYISKQLKEQIVKAKCSCISFTKMKV
jgi:hypothetical protein